MVSKVGGDPRTKAKTLSDPRVRFTWYRRRRAATLFTLLGSTLPATAGAPPGG
ncbi:MAG TPA: hypothetical protein VI893_02455 [Thermoplasmata archaeon]|nr:hypothetical protein [Thermoplasmata archaeon]